VARVALYGGWGAECPCCGGRFRRFAEEAAAGRLSCPRCESRQRHRLLCLHLGRDVFAGGRTVRVLHFAPERSVRSFVERQRPASYLSVDLEAPDADLHADITALPLPDQSYDLVLCSHVLEHVPDDAAAMREMRRVLTAGGVAVIQSPVDASRHETFEDPSIDDPAVRKQLFSQEDHVRVYGRNIHERLMAAGFEAKLLAADSFGPEEVRRYGLGGGLLPNDLYLCSRYP
jgi:SAM-dependent methyltransferase